MEAGGRLVLSMTGGCQLVSGDCGPAGMALASWSLGMGVPRAWLYQIGLWGLWSRVHGSILSGWVTCYDISSRDRMRRDFLVCGHVKWKSLRGCTAEACALRFTQLDPSLKGSSGIHPFASMCYGYRPCQGDVSAWHGREGPFRRGTCPWAVGNDIPLAWQLEGISKKGVPGNW